ncbi:hypothetical protein [Deinococcus sp. PEB2-63]
MTQPPELWNIPLDHPRILRQLTESGITDIPAEVRLVLHEANMEEIQIIERAQSKGGRFSTDPIGMYAELIEDRAEPRVTPEIALAAAKHLRPSEAADLLQAYITGKRDPEGKLGAAVRQTLSGISDQLLTSLAAARQPSSATSTD